ncbi:MAG: hypothetical protein A2622_01680 [Bdellovibrionales bacterium RIFCSPHIGHO2_01_FULL_40_29]|nr:MAG: hypothetical protein A2622_01680 [Bdellovibrionales bacterium RIFCSPHIGHO2_01_FULL_40_29]OFZ33806.1 MAG: hypothetical protein A3D17_02100 [Bdellovibrionales bacterium RIFCSPHIGHO2_02_FULL_40_15]
MISIFALFLIPFQTLAFSVAIDPGHGGVDVGTSRGTFVESKIVYQIAERIQQNLSADKDITIHLTRTERGGKSLEERVLFAHQKNVDLFLSLHANSSTSAQVSGMEYYFSAKQPGRVLLKRKTHSPSGIVDTITTDLVDFGKMKHSLEFSKKIQMAARPFLNANTFGKHRSPSSKIRRAPFYVIENTSMPAVLVEVGFISNQREARKLVTPEYQAELARALSDAITSYKMSPF